MGLEPSCALQYVRNATQEGFRARCAAPWHGEELKVARDMLRPWLDEDGGPVVPVFSVPL